MGRPLQRPTLKPLKRADGTVRGYPERFAQLVLGHNSPAVHRAYARNARVTLPPLEDYEKGATAAPVVPLPISTTA